jgi:hypothetical protein
MTAFTPSNLSRQVFGETSRRAVTFLTAIAAYPTIRAALVGAGYSQEEHAKGWGLLLKVSAFPITVPSAQNAAVDAMSELEVWQGPGFLRARAALRHLHPEQEAFVFGDLDVRKGRECVPTVATFLARCGALQDSPARKETRKADHAALETLSKRGIDEEARRHLQHLVDLASTETTFAVEKTSEDVTKRDEDIVALYRWLEDWRDTARAVVTQRSQLIRLGIARRRAAKVVKAVAPEAPMVTPVAPPVAPDRPIDIDEEGVPSSRASLN